MKLIVNFSLQFLCNFHFVFFCRTFSGARSSWRIFSFGKCSRKYLKLSFIVDLVPQQLFWHENREPRIVESSGKTMILKKRHSGVKWNRTDSDFVSIFFHSLVELSVFRFFLAKKDPNQLSGCSTILLVLNSFSIVDPEVFYSKCFNGSIFYVMLDGRKRS